MRELIVDLGERSYPIYIGEGLLAKASSYFDKHNVSKKSPLMIITDTNVAPNYLKALTVQLADAGYKVCSAIVPAGEQSKSLSQLESLVTIALQNGLDRKSTIVALGGGVVGDLAGFVAASFMRGVRFVQVPTTILAHDSSVGGKVAVNHPLAKNIIGAFHQPDFVLYDISTLISLPERDTKAGLSEVVKHGLIWDEAFVDWCIEHAPKLLDKDSEALSYALYKGCSVKAKVVSEDEQENGLRGILNLGHTIGHALEAVAGYNELLHGEAISIGMIGSAHIGVYFGASESLLHKTTLALESIGLPTRIPAQYSTDEIIEAMMHDKKFKEGDIVFIVPTEIGKVEIRNDVPVSLIKEVIERLKQEG